MEFLLDRSIHRPLINYENKFGQTPLIRACIIGNHIIVSALLKRKAKINQQNIFGKIALHYAVCVGSERCTQILLENGADPNLHDFKGISAFSAAEENGFPYIQKIMVRFCFFRGYFYFTISY